jgi:PAS domain S-box-containing protein
VWVNQATEQYFGLDREEIIGRDKRRLIREQIAEIFAEPDRFADRVIATYDDNTYTEEFECHVLGGDGREERWLEHWSQPIESGLYAGGRIEHYTDITDRVTRERELSRFRRAVEASGHAIYMTDAGGQITYVNPAFEAIMGYSSDEAVGKTPRILQSGEHDDEYYRTLWETVRAGEVWEEEITDRRKSGERYCAEQTITPVTDEDGDIDYAHAIDQNYRRAETIQWVNKKRRDRFDSLPSLNTDSKYDEKLIDAFYSYHRGMAESWTHTSFLYFWQGVERLATRPDESPRTQEVVERARFVYDLLGDINSIFQNVLNNLADKRNALVHEGPSTTINRRIQEYTKVLLDALITLYLECRDVFTLQEMNDLLEYGPGDWKRARLLREVSEVQFDFEN